MSRMETIKVEKQLGKGGYATVFLAHDSHNTNFAIKMISKARKQADNIQREVEAGRRLHHPNIVQYKAHSEDVEHDYLLFEYMEGMDLFSYLEKRKFQSFTEEEVKDIATQLIAALTTSHKAGVVHLDIKLDNIMINPSDHTVKLIDFGLCDFITEENHGMITRRVGSEEYCAPEILSFNSTSFDGVKLDVWCLGIVLYSLLTAQFPFDAKRRRSIMAVGGHHPQARINFGSAQCQDLLKKMLETDPTKRITLEEVAVHPWFASQSP